MNDFEIVRDNEGKKVKRQVSDARQTEIDTRRAPSTNPNYYTHTRRSFKMLLTNAMEAEINSKIQGIANAKVKREIRAFFEDELVFRWNDPTMVKLRNNLEPATAVALEAAWIGQ